jgi:hypothetical protein
MRLMLFYSNFQFQFNRIEFGPFLIQEQHIPVGVGEVDEGQNGRNNEGEDDDEAVDDVEPRLVKCISFFQF